jgi:hypothetical protein
MTGRFAPNSTICGMKLRASAMNPGITTSGSWSWHEKFEN